MGDGRVCRIVAVYGVKEMIGGTGRLAEDRRCGGMIGGAEMALMGESRGM